MRLILKIILLPFTAVLSILVMFACFIIGVGTLILNIFSAILTLGAIASFLEYFFAWPIGTSGQSHTLLRAILATVFAFLFSPYGIPSFAAWLTDKVDDLNEWVKSI